MSLYHGHIQALSQDFISRGHDRNTKRGGLWAESCTPPRKVLDFFP